MSIRNLIFGVSSVKVSYMIRFDSLLQNATDVITKCDVYYKLRQYSVIYTECVISFVSVDMLEIIEVIKLYDRNTKRNQSF